MHEENEQQNSGEGQDAAPVDGTSVPPLQDQVVVEEEIVERTEVTPVEPTVADDDGEETKVDQETRETD